MTPREAAEAFVKNGPPFFGHSDFKDCKKLKEAGARFDGKRKMWYANTDCTFIALYNTGKWEPEERINPQMIVAVMREKKRIEDAKDAESRKRKEPTKEEKERKMRDRLSVPENEPEALQKLMDMGVHESQIAATATIAEFGPRAGISDARRLIRAFSFGLVTPKSLMDGSFIEKRAREEEERAKKEKEQRKRAERLAVSKAAKKSRYAKTQQHTKEIDDKGGVKPGFDYSTLPKDPELLPLPNETKSKTTERALAWALAQQFGPS